MVFKNPTTTGTVLQLPIISVEERQKIRDVIKYAKEIRDKDTESILSDLLNRIDSAEATMRNLYKTLTVYRNRIPKLIRATLRNKKKEVYHENHEKNSEVDR